MDYLSVFQISSAGMSAERARVDAAAMNLANMNTVQGGGGVYQPVRAVLRTSHFSSAMDAETLLAAPWSAIEPNGALPRLVPEPGHPLANSEGFVPYPGVDPAAEMLVLMSALRSYEANVAALNTARALVLKTLDIGRSA